MTDLNKLLAEIRAKMIGFFGEMAVYTPAYDREKLRLVAALEKAREQRHNYITNDDWAWSKQMDEDDAELATVLRGEQ